MTWSVPSRLYGRSDDVRALAIQFAAAVRTGLSIGDAAGEVLGTELVPVDAAHPGLIVLGRPWQLDPEDEPNFHVDLPWAELYHACALHDDPETMERAVRQALPHLWSFIGLFGHQRIGLAYYAATQLEVIEAAALHWSTLAAVGDRYHEGFVTGVPLSEIITYVTFCLARQGAPVDDLRDL